MSLVINSNHSICMCFIYVFCKYVSNICNNNNKIRELWVENITDMKANGQNTWVNRVQFNRTEFAHVI